MSFKSSSTAVKLFVGAIVGAVFFMLPGCQGPAGPAGKDGMTMHDTVHIYDTTLKKDTIIRKDTTIVLTRDTLTINDTLVILDTIISRDTTVIYDTLLMNTSCLSCHSNAKMDSIETQYKMSFHFTRQVINNSSKYCQRCHTSEGFKEITANGRAMAQAAVNTATAIGCNTCHKMNSFDFPVDTATAILRTTSPVVLNYNNSFNGSTGVWATPATATDLGAGVKQGGVNNLCGTCHQIRGATAFTFTDTNSFIGDTSRPNTHKFARKDSTAPFVQLPFFPVTKVKPTDTVPYLVGRSFSVHDGNQMNLRLGQYAYEYTGVTYKGKDTATNFHMKDNCAYCHVYTKFNAADTTGGHTFRPNENDPKCKTCHDATTGGLEPKIKADSAAVRTLLNALGEALVARKVFRKSTSATTGVVSYAAVPTHDFYGTLISPAAADSAVLYAATATGNVEAPTTGILNYINQVTWAKVATPAYSGRLGRAWTGGELGAAYNYGYINSELTNGVHNPAYAKDVLQASINWLTANP